MKISNYIKQQRPVLFRYFGSKQKLAPMYPAPLYDIVIEPFCGAAGYSCWHHQRRVILYEKDPITFGTVHYLIHATPEEIMRLPRMYEEGASVDDYNIPQEAKWLMGFWIGVGDVMPRKTKSPWSRGNYSGVWSEDTIRRVAHTVRRIKHWKVYNKSWEDIDPNRYGPATWFVDPPYQEAGKQYRLGPEQINFPKLGEWCRALPGQVIACENRGADWLPFRDLYLAQANNYNQGGRVEVIWTKGCRKVGFGLVP